MEEKVEENAEQAKVIDKQTLTISILERDVEVKDKIIKEKDETLEVLEVQHEEVK